MKMPKDLSGQQLIQKLKRFGYVQTRQSGSHIRLTTQQNGQHHLSVPNHDPLKIGTLASIITGVAEHFGINKEDVTKQLF